MKSWKGRVNMFFQQDKFPRVMKSTLKRHNMALGQQLSENVYEIKSGMVSFEIDVAEAQASYEETKSAELLEQLIDKLAIDFVTKYKLDSFKNAQSSIRLLLMRDEDIKPAYLAREFIENIKIVVAFASDSAGITPLDGSYARKWGIPVDVLFAVGDKNMCDILKKTEAVVSEISGRIRVMEFPSATEELRAAFVACSYFRRLANHKMGTKFLAVFPSSSTLLVIEDVMNNVIESFGTMIIKEYEASPNRLSTDVFLFTPNGIEIAGRFQSAEI